MDKAYQTLQNHVQSQQAERSTNGDGTARQDAVRQHLTSLLSPVRQAICAMISTGAQAASIAASSRAGMQTRSSARAPEDTAMTDSGSNVNEADTAYEAFVAMVAALDMEEEVIWQQHISGDIHGELDSDFGNVVDGPGDITIEGKTFAIHDYLGESYTKLILELRNAKAIPDADLKAILVTDLFPHQRSATAMLMHLLDSFTEGGILADEMGLGKTLATLLTLRLDRARHGCFDLIVTSKTTAIQWQQESILHFRPEHRARVLLLDDPQITCQELLDSGYELVIVTYQFLALQYKKFLEHQQDKTNDKMIKLSIFSPLYRMLNLPLKHMVIDEAQYGQNIWGISHQAFSAIYRSGTLLLTGTPIKHRWSSVFPLIHLLPGHPFKTDAVFQHVFGSFEFLRQKPTEFARLVKFLQGFIVARPASILKLPAAKLTREEFRLDGDEEESVLYWMLKWQQAMRSLREKRKREGRDRNQTGANTKSDMEKTFHLLLRSQQHSLHPALADRHGDDVSTENIAAFAQRLKASAREDLAERGGTKASLQPANDGSSGPFARPAWGELAQEHTETVKLHLSIQAMFSKHGQGASQLFKETETQQKKKKKKRQQPKKKQPMTKEREKWLGKVEAMPDDELQSSRVVTILELVQRLQEEHPGEKIAIFSRYLKFLDIVAEALRRLNDEGADIQCLRFDGTMDGSERMTSRFTFRKSQSAQTIILITAGAGGAGMNLTSASIVVQCEPWWVASEEWQAWFRVYRPGQTHEVSIFTIEACNSLVDVHIASSRDSKAEVIEEFMEKLRYTDEEDIEIPEIAPHW